MAKRTTTTQAKTKTSRTRTSAAKTTARTKRASVSKKTVSTTTSQKKANVLSLRLWHILSFGIFAVLIALTAVFMNNTSYDITLSYVTRDSLSGALVPAYRQLMDIELRWLVIAALSVSLVLPLLYLTSFEKRYQVGLQNKLVPWRWFDLAISGAIIAKAVALVSGISDVASLKLVGFTAVVIALLGWLAERENMRAAKAAFASFWVGILAKLILVGVLASAAIATPLYGEVRATWFVYALYGALGISLLAYSLTHYQQLKGKDYVKTERNYLVYNLVGKAAFAVILIVAFMK